MSRKGSIRPKPFNFERKKNGYRLSGTKLFVPDALGADYVICAARTGKKVTDISLFLVEAGSTGLGLTPLETLAGDKLCALIFDGVSIPRGTFSAILMQGGRF